MMMVLLLNLLENIQTERKMGSMKDGGQMATRNISIILKKTKVLERTSNGIQMESCLH